jgi:hypothetical protein
LIKIADNAYASGQTLDPLHLKKNFDPDPFVTFSLKLKKELTVDLLCARAQ